MNSDILSYRLVLNFNNKSKFHSYLANSTPTVKADVSSNFGGIFKESKTPPVYKLKV